MDDYLKTALANVGARIDLALRRRNWRLQDLINNAPINQSILFRWRKGQSEPSEETVRKVAAALEVSERWLRDGVGRMEETPHLRDESTDGSALSYSPAARAPMHTSYKNPGSRARRAAPPPPADLTIWSRDDLLAESEELLRLLRSKPHSPLRVISMLADIRRYTDEIARRVQENPHDLTSSMLTKH